MRFVREQQSAAIDALASAINDALQENKRVLWLTSGGSNIAASVEIMSKLQVSAKGRLGGLAVMPMDERYGLSGHEDSNVAQLISGGFEAGEATLIDVLVHNLSLDETIDFYSQVAGTALNNAVAIIGQYGIGPDGHIAGVLPGSLATEPTELTVVGYKWKDYTRMTLTPFALQKTTSAYVLAYGQNKTTAVKRLYDNKEPLVDLPAKLLYDIANVQVYNDSIESEE